jgi:hypothetical protein
VLTKKPEVSKCNKLLNFQIRRACYTSYLDSYFILSLQEKVNDSFGDMEKLANSLLFALHAGQLFISGFLLLKNVADQQYQPADIFQAYCRKFLSFYFSKPHVLRKAYPPRIVDPIHYYYLNRLLGSIIGNLSKCMALQTN